MLHFWLCKVWVERKSNMRQESQVTIHQLKDENEERREYIRGSKNMTKLPENVE